LVSEEAYEKYLFPHLAPEDRSRKLNLGVGVWGMIRWREDNRERTSCQSVFSPGAFLRIKGKGMSAYSSAIYGNARKICFLHTRIHILTTKVS